MRPNDSVRVATASTKKQYRIKIEAKPGCKLANARAYVDEQQRIAIEAIVSSRNKLITYVTRRKTIAYARPSRHYASHILGAGAHLMGTRPSHQGWITLIDGMYVLDDGSLGLASNQSSNREKFREAFELPDDAMLDQATSEIVDNFLLVRIPRLPRMEIDKPRIGIDEPRMEIAPRKRQASTITGYPSMVCQRDELSTEYPSHRPPETRWRHGILNPTFSSRNRSEEQKYTDSKRTSTKSSNYPVDGPEQACKSRMEEIGPSKNADEWKKCFIGSNPILEDATPNLANVSSPVESKERWVATSAGGFVLAQ